MSETATHVVEESKPSKLARVRNAAFNAGIVVIPSAVMVGASLIGYKASLNNLDAAKLMLDASKLNQA